jgi:release factor glutamine methyltransferase
LNDAAVERATKIRERSSGDDNDDDDAGAPSAPPTMPSLEHLSYRDFDHVYEPSDDTYLLMDAIGYEVRTGAWDHLVPEEDCDHDKDNAASAATGVEAVVVALEIGCGSGVPSIVARQEWKRRFCGDFHHHNQDDYLPSLPTSRFLISFATDLNPRAARLALRTAIENACWTDECGCLEFVHCDLAGCLLERLKGRVDLLMFNPPYVPTPDEDVASRSGGIDAPLVGGEGNIGGGDGDVVVGIEASWAGGELGRRVVDRAVPHIAQLLSPRGIAYMVTVDDNRPQELAGWLRNDHDLEMVPLLRRRAFNEHLTVQKITKRTTTTATTTTTTS